MPKSRNAVENDPSMKYFTADSFDRVSRRLYPHSTYVEIEVISSPKKIITRSLAEALKSMPVVANINSAKYSPVGSDSSSTQRSEIKTVKNVTIRKIIEKKRRKSSVTTIPPKDVSASRPHRLMTAAAAATSPASESAPATLR